jgi:hypothetical protein
MNERKSATTTALAPIAQQELSFDRVQQMAVAVAKSGLFGVKTTEQALSLMLLAQAEGVYPMTAARDFHIIQGRPALKADAMLARFQAAGGRVQWLESSDKTRKGQFSHPAGGELLVEWNLERAKQAGLLDRDNWKAYPQQMLRARCISEGVRAVFPGVAVGTYTVEEARDLEPHDPSVVSVQTPTAELMAEHEYADHLAAIDASVDVETLREAFKTGYTRARELNDKVSSLKLEAAYNARKHLLSTAV